MANFKKPWDQQEKEPNEHYRFFLIYKDLGKERTLLNAYALEKPEKSLTAAPAYWRKISADWRWVKRAEAYDLSVKKTETKEIESNDKRIKETAESLQLKILRRIDRVVETGKISELDRDNLGIYNLILSSKSKASDFVNNVVKNMQSQRLEVKVSKVPDFHWD